MDLRIQKTKVNIINAFLTLREEKPIEKITVTELSKAAMINKSTFYLHYKDIYDLSEQLEMEVVDNVIRNISSFRLIIDDTERFTIELFEGYLSQSAMTSILFSKGRESLLPAKTEEIIKKNLLNEYPELEDNSELDMALSYCIYGGYHAYAKNKDHDVFGTIEKMGRMSDAVIRTVVDDIGEIEQV